MKNILIAPAHYQVYRSASRRLARRMGAQAPSAETLIQYELSQRTPRLIADEYLEHWHRTGARPTRIPDRLTGLRIPTGDPRRN
jgi:hypothetical protein